MQYGAAPSNLLESLALRLGTVPLPVLDALLPPMKARAILTASRLGVFEALAEGAASALEVATRCHLDPEATEMLLRTLAAADYVEQRGAAYRLAPLARRSLLRSSPLPLWGFAEWSGQLWDTLAGLEDFVRSGAGDRLRGQLEDAAALASCQRAALEIARFEAADLARHVPVPAGARRLLEIGDSLGLFAATLARRHAGLRAEVLVQESGGQAARELAREAGIEGEAVRLAAGPWEAHLGENELDVVLLANALPHLAAAESAALLLRVARALRPGGRIAIWEIDLPAAEAPPAIGDLAALFFRLTSKADAFRAADAAEWLRQAGFAAVRTRRLRRLPGKVLLLAEKPAEKPAAQPLRNRSR